MPHPISGTWRGSYEQYGQTHHFDMKIDFRADHVMKGDGKDGIGEFTIDGQWTDCGQVRFIKEYVGKHNVDYQGSIDNTGKKITGKYWGREDFEMYCITAAPAMQVSASSTQGSGCGYGVSESYSFKTSEGVHKFSSLSEMEKYVISKGLSMQAVRSGGYGYSQAYYVTSTDGHKHEFFSRADFEEFMRSKGQGHMIASVSGHESGFSEQYHITTSDGHRHSFSSRTEMDEFVRSRGLSISMMSGGGSGFSESFSVRTSDGGLREFSSERDMEEFKRSQGMSYHYSSGGSGGMMSSMSSGGSAGMMSSMSSSSSGGMSMSSSSSSSSGGGHSYSSSSRSSYSSSGW